MQGWVQLSAWKRRVLPAPFVLGALLVIVHQAGSRAFAGAAPEAKLAAAPAPARAITRPVATGPVALETLEIRPTPNPLRGLDAAELHRLALTKPASLGSVCVGRPNRGHLFNASELASEPGIKLMTDREHTFGTAATVQAIRTAASELHDAYPHAPDVNVGDLSREQGGYLRPHHSHQLGVDADIGYFYRAGGKWYARANAENLDRELTWAFIKSLIAQGSVEYIFMDRSVQALLQNYALDQGEDGAWLATLFESPAHRDTLIRHAYGHITHFHVRFLDPAAERTGRLLEARLHPRRRGR